MHVWPMAILINLIRGNHKYNLIFMKYKSRPPEPNTICYSMIFLHKRTVFEKITKLNIQSID